MGKKKATLDKVSKSDVFTEDLPCELTNEEKASVANELAALLLKKVETEREKKETVSRFNDQINSIEGQIAEVVGVITHGERRSVECLIEYSWDEGRKVVIRLDTGEEVRGMDITPEDRQAKLLT